MKHSRTRGDLGFNCGDRLKLTVLPIRNSEFDAAISGYVFVVKSSGFHYPIARQHFAVARTLERAFQAQ